MRVLRVVGSGELPEQAADDDAAAAPEESASASERDGQRRLLVADDEGVQYLLAVDEALVTACGAARQSAAAPERERRRTSVAHLSPREIQTRIRTGESPQDLAAETGMDVERVLRFGYAVMQERSRVGDEARRARARRDGDGALVAFGATVDRRFSAAGVDPADVEWDAFRRPDGSWTISATWSDGSGERHAYWAFSLTARTVLPADETAADLLSERPLRAVVQAVPDPSDGETAADAVFDQENPGGYARSGHGSSSNNVSSPANVRPHSNASSPATAGAGAADSASSNAPASDPSDRGDGYGTPPLPLRLADPVAEPDVDAVDDTSSDPSAEEPSETFASVHVLGRSSEASDAEQSLADSLFGPETDDGPTDDAGDTTDSATASAPPAARPAAKSARRRSGRDQVPSWDDILLGVRRKQD